MNEFDRMAFELMKAEDAKLEKKGKELQYTEHTKSPPDFYAYHGQKIHNLTIDIETFSEAELPKTGVYRYAEDKSFEILLFGFSVDDGPVSVVDLTQGEEIPLPVLVALLDENIIKNTFNANFERICLSRHLWDLGLLKEGIYLNPHGWHCDMVWSGYMGLPMSLKGAGAVLGLEQQKMQEGKELITYFCKPYRPTSKNEYSDRNFPKHRPIDWLLFKIYNKRDVEVEMSIAKKLQRHPVPQMLWEEYWLDQEINDRGILIDLPMVERAIEIDRESGLHLKEEMQAITKLPTPQSVIQLQRWLKENGVELTSLAKKEIEKQLKDVPEPMKTVLILRQQLAMSAVKKYKAMEAAVCKDGRLRGMFKFYGANRSGRFCLAEGTPILVKAANGNIGEKPIEDVTREDLVFDGEDWVHHDGVVFSGEKDVITWDGITATPEHMVFLDSETKITLAEAKEKGLLLWKRTSFSFNDKLEERNVIL